MNLNTEAGVLLPWVIQEIVAIDPNTFKLLTVKLYLFYNAFSGIL
jgi:hypothetical protein